MFTKQELGSQKYRFRSPLDAKRGFGLSSMENSTRENKFSFLYILRVCLCPHLVQHRMECLLIVALHSYIAAARLSSCRDNDIFTIWLNHFLFTFS